MTPPVPDRTGAGRPPVRRAPGTTDQRLYLISARTMWHVVSDGGWTPIRSAVLRMVSLRA
ncbi:hypothetical protein GCM10022207_80760 [Streptomyces lannensis]|uniref:Uncharacterized protein n=1 Tax=Streptomyces lannensis TaxID=766498 RepID=A0ABP7LFN5_9ACTN